MPGLGPGIHALTESHH